MSLHLFSRFALTALSAVAIGHLAVAELKGDYNIEFVVQGTPYTGTAKFTPGTKGELGFSYELTTPSRVTAEMKGKMNGDSLTFEGKYDDKGRNCTGTMSGKGTAEKNGSKAAGTVDINDACSGTIPATFRVWR